MEPKHLYTIAWTQPYFGITMAEVDALLEQLIDLDIEINGVADAQQELERIMKL